MLGSGGVLGCLFSLDVGLHRGAALPIAASAVLLLLAIVILHDSGMKNLTIAIIIGSIALLVGLVLLVVWLSLHNDPPTW